MSDLIAFWEILHKIEERLKMTVDQPTFDAALATLVTNYNALEADLTEIATDVASINTSLTQFITDYNAKTGVDLTSELASITALTNEVAADTTNAVSDVSG